MSLDMLNVGTCSRKFYCGACDQFASVILRDYGYEDKRGRILPVPVCSKCRRGFSTQKTARDERILRTMWPYQTKSVKGPAG